MPRFSASISFRTLSLFHAILSNAERAPPSSRKKINSFAGIGNAHLINGTTFFLLSTIIALVRMHSISSATPGLDRSDTYRRIAVLRRSTFRFPRRWTKARRLPCILSRICTSPGRRFCTKSRPCLNSPRCLCGSTSSRTSGRFRSPRGSRVPPRQAPDSEFLHGGKHMFLCICVNIQKCIMIINTSNTDYTWLARAAWAFYIKESASSFLLISIDDYIDYSTIQNCNIQI